MDDTKLSDLQPLDSRNSPDHVRAVDTEEGTIDNGSVAYKVYKRRWFGLALLTLLNITASFDWLTFAPVSQKAAVYYGVSENSINWLSTGFLFAFVVAAPATIYVLHLGPKPSIIAASGLMLVGNWVRFAGSYSADGGNFGAAMAGQILTGFAQPFVLSAPTRYSDMWFTERGRITATALASLANPFGGAIIQLIVPAIVDVPSSMSMGVLIVAIVATVFAIPSIFLPAKPPSPPGPSGNTPKLSLRQSFKALNTLEIWLLLIPYSVFVGFFNSISSLLNQILMPYGFTSDEAGIAGALLIVVGLVASAIASPIIDRKKTVLVTSKCLVPVIAVCYVVFIFMPGSGSLAGPYTILSVLGASSFILVPVALEFLCEITHPLSPEVTSTIAWSGGQLLGGIFIVISDALKAGPEADPPLNLFWALVFSAIIASLMVPLVLCLGLFGRADRVALRRTQSDQGHSELHR
ncbi:major facilitator superfamily domain-containing protein [Microdochium trichocladiopsis]|uniref:Major facilitator superfamily domain-containing protein n=1 Tax=Microdochium trichocladiopsis TaxID=1682393 RepID=A0A9P8Y2G3_9PEZI|nr:major facilitator superfamily domain-containing protein [Microdochium trichocladiopsis]KAH7027886.1 major facilitator superfamily domain-containing protein [Microdochium trichocladiopsis]